MAQDRKKIILIVLIAILTAVIAVGVAFAANLSLISEDKFVSRASTSAFTVGIGGAGTENRAESLAAVTAAAVNIGRTAGDGVNLPGKYDLLVFSDVSVTLAGAAGTVYPSGGGICTVFAENVFSDLQIANLQFSEATDFKVAAVPSDKRNVYVSDLFSLKMQNDETLHNTAAPSVPEGKFTDYKNIYVVNDITVNSDTVVNSPAFVHLLYSALTLNAKLTVKHPYRGVYAIEAFGQAAVKGAGTLEIDAPNAFYSTAAIAAVTADTVTVDIDCAVDFAADEVKRSALISDALAYVRAATGDMLFGDADFRRNYHNYGVTIDYSVRKVSGDGSLLDSGNAERGVSNGVFEVTANVFYGGQTAGTDTFGVTLAGTGDAACAENTAAYLDAYIQKGLVGGKLNTDVEISRAVEMFYGLSGYTGTAVFASNGVYTDFDAVNADGNVRINTFTASVTNGNTVFSADGAANILSIVMTRPYKVFEDVTETISIQVGEAAAVVSVKPSSVGEEEKRAYLNRHLDTPYFSDASDSSPVLYLKDGAIYVGGNTNPVVPSDLGYDFITYNVYLVDKTSLESITDDSSLQQVIDNKLADYTDWFSVDNGLLTPQTNAVIQPSVSEALMLFVTFGGENGFSAYRKILIPSGGLGGSDYTEYIKGDTFAPYFTSLADGKLINSTAGESGSAYKFASEFNSQVFLRMSFTNQSEIEAFCTLVSRTNPSYWQINIDVMHVPNVNTSVYVVAEFYVEKAEGGVITDEVISTQYYSFVIPGIYRSDTDFDAAFYSAVIAADKDGQPLYDSYDGYLLCDGAGSRVDLLDLSDKTYGNISSLKGIELLTGTSAFIFDGHSVTDISALGKCSDVLKSLSMVSCGITDAMLAEGRPMYALNGLIELHLDKNDGITKFGGSEGNYFYRTVEILTMSECGMDNIDGISEIASLSVLDLSGNAVALFEEITALNLLKEVRLGNNVYGGLWTEGGVYYGTAGKLNLPVYVTLLNKGVTVYTGGGEAFKVDDSAADITQGITSEEYLGALIINALIIPEKHFGSVVLPQSVYAGQSGGTEYNVTVYYLLKDGMPVTDYSNSGNVLTPASATGRLSVILGVTYGSATIYGQFEIEYLP